MSGFSSPRLSLPPCIRGPSGRWPIWHLPLAHLSLRIWGKEKEIVNVYDQPSARQHLSVYE